MAALAAEAGVSEPTIYYSFGSKEAVLVEALDIAIAGDDEPVPTLERPWALQVLESTDDHEQIALMVHGAADILLRAAPLLTVLQAAASTSAEMASRWKENVRQRRTVQGRFAAALAERGALRPDLTAETAADLCALHLGPEAYMFLVTEMGWSHDLWVDRTIRTLTHALLRSP